MYLGSALWSSQLRMFDRHDEGHACDMLDSIKTELDSNELLLADFPESASRSKPSMGFRNRANWATLQRQAHADRLDRKGGCATNDRGQQRQRSDHQSRRPYWSHPRYEVQTSRWPNSNVVRVLWYSMTRKRMKSARSLVAMRQSRKHPRRRSAWLSWSWQEDLWHNACTVIRPGDMADNILDRNRHPEWNGKRTKMVYAFPKNETLWERTPEIRAEGMRGGDGGEAATEFYRQNQAVMDEGAVIAWQERFNYDELSAIQHAMNLKLQDEAAFFAEYQNQPLPAETVVDGMLKPEEVASKINRMDRGLVSIGATISPHSSTSSKSSCSMW